MTRTSQNQREDIFNLPHPLPLGPKGWTCPEGCPGGEGVVTGQTEPRIMRNVHISPPKLKFIFLPVWIYMRS